MLWSSTFGAVPEALIVSVSVPACLSVDVCVCVCVSLCVPVFVCLFMCEAVDNPAQWKSAVSGKIALASMRLST